MVKVWLVALLLMLGALSARTSAAEPDAAKAEARTHYRQLDAEIRREVDAGHGERAYTLAEAELAFVLSRLDPKGPEADDAFQAVSFTAYATSRYARSLQTLERALGIEDPAGNSTSQDVVHLRFVAAALLTLQERFVDAGQQLRKILAIEKSGGHDASEEYLLAVMSLAVNAAQTAHFDDAQRLIGEALERARALAPPNLQYEVAALQDRALISEMQGSYPEARAQFGDAVARSSGLNPQAQPLDALTLTRLFDNLALLDEIEGRYSEAESDFAKSAVVLAQHPGLLPGDEVALANGRAALHAFEGRPDAGLEIERVLTQAEQLGAGTTLYATVLDNGGLIDMQQGRIDRARRRLQRAFDIESALHGEVFPDLVAPLLNLAQLAIYQNDLGGAQRFIDRAQKIVDDTPVQPAFGVGVELAQGRLAGLHGAYGQAEARTERAEKLATAALGETHPLLAGVHLQMADLLFAQGQPAQATGAYESSFAVLFGEYVREFPAMNERERLNFYAGADALAAHAFSFDAKYGGDPQVAGDAYDLALQQKNYVGAGITALRARIATTKDAAAEQALDRLVELRSRIAALDYASADADARRRQLADLEAQAKASEDQLVARFPTNFQPAPVSWRDVRRALRHGEAAVEIFRFRRWNGVRDDGAASYAAAVVTPAANAPHIVLLADAKTMEGPALASYRQESGLAPFDRTVYPVTLYDAFWKPLETALDGAHRVYLAPSGVLAQIAPAVIALPEHRFLADAYDVRVVTSTRDLLVP
ncbi:MAG: hypothetical protein ACLPYS_03705, partial [Vulcanimicrobiaceae bacterium]